MRAPIIFLALALVPKARTPLPFYWSQPDPGRKHPYPALQTPITTCSSTPFPLFSYTACPISIDVALVRPREMAHSNPASSSSWTGTLLAPFARRRYRTVNDLARRPPGPWPVKAEDSGNKYDRSDEEYGRSDKEYETSDEEEEEEEDQSSQPSNDDDEEEEEEEEAEAAEQDSDDYGEHAKKEDASLQAESRSTYPIDEDQSSADDDFIVVKGDPTSQSVIAAWNRTFCGQSQLILAREDALPFTIGQRLGGGGVGIVFETHIEGLPLALKRTYTRRISSQQLNEIKILGRISKHRHRHVVELIGSYLHEQRRGFEIGMLIWPVAQTDLASLLHDFGILQQYYRDQPQSQETKKIRAAMEPLLALIPSGVLRPDLLRREVKQVVFLCENRIRRSLGCIANAVAYLHEHNIRHKDLKPSQVLLSTQGLWLADFGWSADMSEHDSSTTSGDEMMTTKYQAPERANSERCGRSEDIFSLGCIFLEMGYGMISLTRDNPRPWMQKGWSFQANLDDIQGWMKPLNRIVWKEKFSEGVSFRNVTFTTSFPQLLMPMLAHASSDRPSIQDVLHALSVATFVGHGNSMFIDGCCRPHAHVEFI